MENDDYLKGIYRLFSIAELDVENDKEECTVIDAQRLCGTKLILVILNNLTGRSVIY